jgi:stage IV sporulation protein A
MQGTSIYQDIASRTGGDIYIGVVGPVRTGKSTFIKRFMESLVIPNIENDAWRDRATDELPQSAAGRTIMTTEPKFIPEEAVTLSFDSAAQCRVRLIDCVGYIVPSSLGYIENDQPRMVRTPWFDREVPFNMAAELGTQKVITEHATIGLVITTDGSISEIPREEYAEAEERVVRELSELGKPFSVVLNCVEPESAASETLARDLEERYGVPVTAVNCLHLDAEQIARILQDVLDEFPVREIQVEIPRWITALPPTHWLKSSLYDAIRAGAPSVRTMHDLRGRGLSLGACEFVEDFAVDEVHFGDGSARARAKIAPGLFYRVLSEETGVAVEDETALLPVMQELVATSREFQKYRSALEQVAATGYGIVMPTTEELSLEEPEIIRQSGRYGVRLRASAPSIHMMRADIKTEVSPIVGSEKQSEELVAYLLSEFEQDPTKIWESNIFGKSLHELVNEGLHNKLSRVPPDARMKLTETIERITNDGCSGLICIIL